MVVVDERSNQARELRFSFGRNWLNYLNRLDEAAVAGAEESLREMLSVKSLSGKTFVDIGSGSGLFSLAARRLGASVTSFDVDADSVACTLALRTKADLNDINWIVKQGSALDTEFLRSLGEFDIAYSWGVLHHTGAMWTAVENVTRLVKPGGTLFIALYNDQGGPSRRWHTVKRLYNQFPWLKVPLIIGSTFKLQWRTWVKKLLTLSFKRGADNIVGADGRGMMLRTDIVDWVGGYPFEVASPDSVIERLHAKGFQLVKLKTRQGIGNNEFVFRNVAASESEKT